MKRESFEKWVRIGTAMFALSVGAMMWAGCERTDDANPALPSNETVAGAVRLGNGAPSGAHYTLNIIGVPKGKTADMTGNNGHRIFMPLVGNAKIFLYEGDFQVTDANGTDQDGASFQLPNPDPANSGTTTYSVYARALGTPGGSAVMHLCATDETGNTFCSGDSLVLIRSKHSRFENVTKELLYLYIDLDGNGSVDRIPLFDKRLQGYFWDYDNVGLKLAQLRFYEESTTVE